MACGCGSKKITVQKINRPEQPVRQVVVKDLRQPTPLADVRPIHGYKITGNR
jgi:hypothetical protein